MRWGGVSLAVWAVFAQSAPAGAQLVAGPQVLTFGMPGGGTAGASAFTGGAGAFSGRLSSAPLGFRGFPSISAFPGGVFPPVRTTPGMQVGVITPGGILAPGTSLGSLIGPYTPTPTNAEQGAVTPSLEDLSAAISAAAGPSGPNGALVAPLNDLLTAQMLATGLTATANIGGGVMGGPSISGGTQISLGGSRVVPSGLIEPRKPLPGSLKPRHDLQQIIARSSSLPSKETIRVLTNGPVVVLRGSVASEHERRMAEALLRVSPEVTDVRNDLTIQVPADRSTSR